ncbi:ATP-dependent DNA helicase (plasmid) [Halorientalis sp. IM1011]|nr:ATP-dependent DNA helicase [Halorientalis sp. IM1011]
MIDNTDGCYLVDAGAGTGKTFTVTRRYATILDDADVEPDDVLLATFTESAATEMKERIVSHSSYGIRELADAPIQTFHSRCHDLLDTHGYGAPTHLGIDDRITGSTTILDDDLVEEAHFREFYDRFRADHPEHRDLFRVVDDPTELLDLTKQLAAKGIFPTAEGWYRDGEARLEGDFDRFEDRFATANAPQGGGSRQSRLRKQLGSYDKNACYRSDAPSKDEIRGGRGTKQIDAAWARAAFEEDRAELKQFVHDIYFEYLEFALGRNYLNFAFLQLFAFVLLCAEDRVREETAFEYVMIDEFQDTSEIQFKLALLMAGTDNICVVGDWKQSIYSFQYAAVENITDFETRFERFRADLNDDRERVSFGVPDVDRVELTENYRSTETILEFAPETLVTPAAKSDDVDADAIREEIVELDANAAFDNTRIEGYTHEDEHESVLTKVQAIVDNEEYAVEDEAGTRRPPRHEDITILTRTRDYGRELLEIAREHDLPVSYDGGVELFRSDEAKLLLAWLRILEYDSDRGWAVVLERAGYTLDEIDAILDGDVARPGAMCDFRDALAELQSVGAVARRVFDRYGMQGAYADVLLDTIQSIHETTTLTTGDLIRHIERGIEAGSEHEISTSAGDDSVTVQTIHGAKGTEYPIVILANMNDGKFPPRRRGGGTITYDESIGLRQHDIFAADHGQAHVYDNWRLQILRRCLPDNYDEERRLLYVATTRAKNHVIFAGGDKPNQFLEELDVGVEAYEPALVEESPTGYEQTTLGATIPTPDGPVGHTPHTLMQGDVFEDVTDGKGTEFGNRVHDFAEAYALGESVDSGAEEDFHHVQEFLESLEGELLVEEDAYLPLTVDGDRVTVSGTVDLIHVRDETVEIIDYKTDRGRHGQPEYRKQLSVYYHVVSASYPDRDVTTSIFYTAEGERVEIDPLTRDDLIDIVRTGMVA